jgi:hypothetical protein
MVVLVSIATRKRFVLDSHGFQNYHPNKIIIDPDNLIDSICFALVTVNLIGLTLNQLSFVIIGVPAGNRYIDIIIIIALSEFKKTDDLKIFSLFYKAFREVGFDHFLKMYCTYIVYK